MKIENFQLKEVLGSSTFDWRFRATVDVTPFFGKTVTREVFREYGHCWYFTDNGKYTPEFKMERLVRAFEAKNGKKLQYCVVD